MASNPFDQFDEKSSSGSNPFDKFDAPETPEKKDFMDHVRMAANVLSGPDAIASLASGAVAAPLSGFAGMAGAVLPGPKGQGADWQRRVQEGATYQPRTQGGKAIVDLASKPGELLAEGANALGERNAEISGSPAFGAISNALVQAVPAVIGSRSGGAAPRLTVAQQQAAKYRGQGFSMTPSESGAGKIATTAEGLSGEGLLAKRVSEKNIPVAEQKIAKDLGIEEGVPVNNESLAKVEKASYEKYKTVRGAGRITTDEPYKAAITAIEEKYKSAAEDFPEATRELGLEKTEKVIQGLKKDSFDANSAVDIIKKLREQATKAYIEGEGAHARALREGAKAIEDQLERHIGETNPTALTEFKAARVTLAKAHDARKAIDKNERLNPQTYAEILRKNPQLLTGGAKEVAEFARDNPRSAQKAPIGNTTVGSGDLGYGVGGGLLAAGGHIAAHGLTGGATLMPVAAALVARPATRAFLASKAGQAAMGEKMPPLTPGLARMIAVSQTHQRRLSDEQ